MKQHFTKIKGEKTGMYLSILCAAHCLSLPLLITFLPAMGLGFLVEEEFEFWMVSLSLIFASYVLIKDAIKIHRRKTAIFIALWGFVLIFGSHLPGFHQYEVLCSMLGAALIVWAYFLNWKFSRRMILCKC